MPKSKIWKAIANSKPAKVFTKKFKEEGLFLMLALISVFGFALNSMNILFGFTLSSKLTFGIISILLGIGLMLESKIRTVLRSRKRIDNFTTAKAVTFLVGVLVFFGGLIAMLGLDMGERVSTIIALGNGLAIFMILIEVFFVD